VREEVYSRRGLVLDQEPLIVSRHDVIGSEPDLLWFETDIERLGGELGLRLAGPLHELFTISHQVSDLFEVHLDSLALEVAFDLCLGVFYLRVHWASKAIRTMAPRATWSRGTFLTN
jgi:hypothetical protein